MIYRFYEGCLIRNGINWNRDRASRIKVIVRIGPFGVYFRWRSKHICGKRIICTLEWDSSFARGVKFDFSTLSIVVGENRWTIEALTDYDPKVCDEIYQKRLEARRKFHTV